MKKPVIGAIVVVIIAVVAVGIAVATHTSKSKDMSNMTTTSTSTSSSASPTAIETNQVTIKDMAFAPANIKIQTGTTVTWTNMDSVAHTVTETDGQTGPKSEDIQPGKSFVYTFDNVGTYKYHCSIHPNMTGTVTVVPQGS